MLNSILNKYENDISAGEANNFKLKELFDKLNGRSSLGLSMASKFYDDQNQEAGCMMLTQPNLSF